MRTRPGSQGETQGPPSWALAYGAVGPQILGCQCWWSTLPIIQRGEGGGIVEVGTRLLGVGVWLGEADLATLGPCDLCRVTKRTRIPAPHNQETSREGHFVARGQSGCSVGHCSGGWLRPRSVGSSITSQCRL